MKATALTGVSPGPPPKSKANITVGIASCIGLLDEASIYAKIVRTAGIETKTVICKVGAIDKTEIGLPDQLKVCPGCNESCCNPALQAQVLNDWGADLNVLFFLCF